MLHSAMHDYIHTMKKGVLLFPSKKHIKSCDVLGVFEPLTDLHNYNSDAETSRQYILK